VVGWLALHNFRGLGHLLSSVLCRQHYHIRQYNAIFVVRKFILKGPQMVVPAGDSTAVDNQTRSHWQTTLRGTLQFHFTSLVIVFLLALGWYALLENEGPKRLSLVLLVVVTPLVIAGLIAARYHANQRRAQERTLHQVNELLKILIGSSPLAIIALDPEGKVTMWNTAAERIFGWTQREVLGRLTPTIPSSEQEQFREIMHRVLHGETIIEMIVQRQRQDGSLMDMSLSASPVRDTHGKIKGTIAILIDITNRKRIEESLRKSEAQQRALLNTIPDLIIHLDRVGTVLNYSPPTSGWTTLPPDPVGKSVFDTMPPDRAQQLAYYLERGLRTGELQIWEYEGIFDGELHEREARLMVSDPESVLVIVRDITERKRSERALRASEAVEREQRILAEALRDTITALTSTLDLDAVMNRILENVGRVVPHDATSIVLFEEHTARFAYSRNFSPEAEAFFRNYEYLDTFHIYNEIRATGIPQLIKDTALNPNWLEFPTHREVRSYIGAPIKNRNQIIGILNVDSATSGFFTEEHAERLQAFADQAAIAIQNAQLYSEIRRHADVLNQRVAERTQELTSAHERLQELDRLKTRFIADISHELRTPVANLNLRAHILEHDSPDKRAEHLEVLKRQINSLNSLLEGVLDFSQMERALIDDSRFELLDLNAIVDEVVVMYRVSAEVMGLPLNFMPQPDLPMVRGRADYLMRAVTNLVTNAINYTPSGYIDIHTYCRDRDVYLEIQDTGIGIAPEDLDHLFERFYRGTRVGSSSIPGMGLGLAIVKEIITLHNGEVNIDSTISRGTRFTIRLPAA
jgi:PAS domain S-box-containing protein